MAKIKKEEKLQQVKKSEAIFKIIYWFFAFPEKEISLNDLAKNVGISKTNANKIVTYLVKEDFLKKEILGKTWRISCNPAHKYNITLKIPFNLGQIYESRIIDKIMKKIPNAKSIILFGSCRKGDDTEKSDIDIAVEVAENAELEIYKMGNLEQFGYRKNIPINLHIFSKNKIDLNLFSNIANGIVLSGFLEAKP
ncbi:MAG TPA: nucleotidyltransferase domain-containing protein [Candidatus Nanoarchaeia archaeon]|nr:nucleotidyltransferase domain-containing protein [Candidatus Nanoarchaeia archaeon]